MSTDDTGTTGKGLRVIEGGKKSYRSAKTPSGLTEKQEAFCQALADGMTNADAYRKAFGAEGYQMRTLHSKACSLAARESIRERVTEIVTDKTRRKQHVAAQMSERVSDRVFRNLWKIAEDDSVPPAARVAALTLAAKASGMLVERVETRNLNASVDIEAELKERLEKLFKAS